jgi:hypothetical protein
MSISDIFALPPDEITDDQLTQLIAEFRSRRHLFNLGNKSAGSTKPLSAKAAASASLIDDIEL